MPGQRVPVALALAAAAAISGAAACVSLAQAGAAPAGPGPARGELVIPDSLWTQVKARLAASDREIGYSAVEMEPFGGDALLLRPVLRLFADARQLPRFSGTLTTSLITEAGKLPAFGEGWEAGGLGELAFTCYRLLDLSSGRRTTPAPDSASLAPPPLARGARKDWQALPASLRDLVSRLYAGAEAAGPWLRAAFDAELTAQAAGREKLEAVTAADLLALALVPNEEVQLDQAATLRSDAFKLLERTDRAYLAYGTVLFLRHVEHALHVFSAEGGAASLTDASFKTMRLSTPLGDILIGGDGADAHGERAFLVVETGGDDRYSAAFGSPAGLASPVAVLVDLAGNDQYRDPALVDSTLARSQPPFGAGCGGVGLLLDLAGDDDYAVGAYGLGCGLFGSGILVDYAGNDRYATDAQWGQGAAQAGIGLLVDLAGADDYRCARESQGLGAPLGAGLLLDLAGNDHYAARDDGNISALYEGQSVAMSQGCGYGRRADMGDGHSLAGGFGLLVDAAGDDDYHAQVWSQGCGYWWGVGILEDRAGNDRYRNGKYSSGAAAHFAIGLHVDLAGDDLYNQGNDTAKNQFQGHARDGAIGVFIDGEGDDRYEFHTHCAGSADLASIGLFWDRRGDDRYLFTMALPEGDWPGTPPLGSTTRYEPTGTFRDDLPVYGIFLDTGGRDDYSAAGRGADDSVWEMNRYPRAYGLGLDCGSSAPK